jgi:hypothetical protein
MQSAGSLETLYGGLFPSISDAQEIAYDCRDEFQLPTCTFIELPEQ